MATVNLRRNQGDKDLTLLGGAPDDELADYHMGLRLHLEEPELQKLALGEPEVGNVMEMDAVVRVVMYAKDEGGRRAELLVTNLGLKNADQEPLRESVLYGGR